MAEHRHTKNCAIYSLDMFYTASFRSLLMCEYRCSSGYLIESWTVFDDCAYHVVEDGLTKRISIVEARQMIIQRAVSLLRTSNIIDDNEAGFVLSLIGA